MHSRLSLSELRTALQGSGAVLLSPRVLRGVIKAHLRVFGIGLAVPHARCYQLSKADFRALASARELDVDLASLGDPVLLLPEPDPTWLAERDAEAALRYVWSQLFHLRVHAALDAEVAAGKLTPHLVKRLVHALGQVELDASRSVLLAENLLPARASETEAVTELVATYLELQHFQPPMLEHYFPGLAPRMALLITQLGLDVPVLLARSRPVGAPETPRPAGGDAARTRVPTGRLRLGGLYLDRSPDVSATARREHLIAQAAGHEERGNLVRAMALLRRSLAFGPPDERTDRSLADIERLLEKLCAALVRLLGGDDDARARWLRALRPLVLEGELEGGRYWSQRVRLLYDLQKACDDATPKHTADLVGWALSLGSLAVRRALPLRAPVLVYRHLKRALGRLARVRRFDGHERLRAALESAVATADEVARARLDPPLRETFETVGVQARGRAEEVARDKLLAELLDTVLARGDLQLGDVRDALSRNQLKLPDLGGVGELLKGDGLLRVDRELSLRLDGIYHRGEVYMRGLQKGVSLMFGTAAGRFLFLYFLLPLGGAFTVLEGLKHMFSPFVGLTGGENIHALAALREEVYAGLGLAPQVVHHGAWLLLGVFFLGLLASRVFRSRVTTVGKRLARRGKAALAMPLKLLQHPRIARFYHSAGFFYAMRYFVQPLAFAWVASLLLPHDWQIELLYLAMVFTAVAVGATTLVWRRLEGRLLDGLVRLWLGLRHRFLPNAYRFIVTTFRRALEGLDMLLYAVDERLRYRPGEARASVVSKAALGVVWFALTYLVRVYTKLLVEPQVNPIKHFPVVTVAHKLMLPATGLLFSLLSTPLIALLGTWAGGTIAGVTVFLLPGVFGFLAWELKEGWKLYASNRASTLQPVMVGTKGETVGGLLKPGFHSGTVPKLYKNLRRASARGYERETHIARAGLAQVELQLRRWTERELLAPLALLPAAPALQLEGVRLHANRIQLELASDGERAVMVFEEQSLRLLASLPEPGFFARARGEARDSLHGALLGFYKLAGAELIREQLEDALGRPAAYDISDGCLNVWPREDAADEVQYPLAGATLEPRPVVGATSLPPVPAARVLFTRSLRWEDWRQFWDRPRELAPLRLWWDPEPARTESAPEAEDRQEEDDAL